LPFAFHFPQASDFGFCFSLSAFFKLQILAFAFREKADKQIKI